MNKKDQQQGFSLIELLVALVIIALGMGIVGVSLFQNSLAADLDDQAEEFRQQLRWASDEALITGDSIGLVPVLLEAEPGINERWSVQFFRLRDYEWQETAYMAPFPLHEKLEFELIIDDEPVDFWEWADKEAPDPAMIFYGGGESTAGIWKLFIPSRYRSEVTREDVTEAHLAINVLGDVRWKEREEAREARQQWGAGR